MKTAIRQNDKPVTMLIKEYDREKHGHKIPEQEPEKYNVYVDARRGRFPHLILDPQEEGMNKFKAYYPGTQIKSYFGDKHNGLHTEERIHFLSDWQVGLKHGAPRRDLYIKSDDPALKEKMISLYEKSNLS